MADLYDGEDRADAATLAALRRLGRGAAPRADFAKTLKEEFMHAPALSEPIATGTGRRFASDAGIRIPVVRPQRHPLVDALAIAALLAVVLVGTYVALLASNRPQPGPPTSAAFAPPLAGATPAGSSTLPTTCTTDDLYFGCPDFAQLAGRALIRLSNLDEAARTADRVQLQGWAILPGGSISGGAADGSVHGVVVDTVLSGAYSATFDVPVVVVRGALTNDLDNYQYLDAGTTVDLVRGDTVSYQLGGLVELHNPLGTIRVEFKRAVIYSGQLNAPAALPTGVTTRVEADGKLRQPLGENAAGGSTWVEFYYVWVNANFPPPAWKDATILGPVDPQSAPQGVDGFVLVIEAGPKG